MIAKSLRYLKEGNFSPKINLNVLMIFIALKSKSNDINKLLSMYNPCHAGEVLKEYLGDTSISTAAKHLGVTRAALSRIINGKTGISADMALRLSIL
ncbi:HigA family addiction module antitoxin [Snodgrassella alvi]|uniref:HigA family addiction module antitoxin n=1 Tax=Snodgrassella alvi TaxID=1196083 RepID=UPI003460B2BB